MGAGRRCHKHDCARGRQEGSGGTGPQPPVAPNVGAVGDAPARTPAPGHLRPTRRRGWSVAGSVRPDHLPVTTWSCLGVRTAPSRPRRRVGRRSRWSRQRRRERRRVGLRLLRRRRRIRARRVRRTRGATDPGAAGASGGSWGSLNACWAGCAAGTTAAPAGPGLAALAACATDPSSSGRVEAVTCQGGVPHRRCRVRWVSPGRRHRYHRRRRPGSAGRHPWAVLRRSATPCRASASRGRGQIAR